MALKVTLTLDVALTLRQETIYFRSYKKGSGTNMKKEGHRQKNKLQEEKQRTTYHNFAAEGKNLTAARLLWCLYNAIQLLQHTHIDDSKISLVSLNIISSLLACAHEKVNIFIYCK